MAETARYSGDVYVTGNVRCATFTAPAGAVSGAMLQPGTVEPEALAGNMDVGFIALDITTVRIIAAGVIQNTTEGGVPDGNTDPILQRVNGATDKALRLTWAAASVVEVQFAPVALPPDLDDLAVLTIHLLVDKDANADASANIDVQVFFDRGDTECGGVTAAITETAAPAEKSVTIAASDIPAAPAVMNIALVPSAHASDAIRLYSAWIEYARAGS